MQHYLLYFVALFGLSQSANLVKLAQAPLEMIGFWRLLLSALFMLPLALRKDDLKNLLQNPQLMKWTGISGLFFFLHLWTFFYASQNTSIANCMIIFSINPLFTAIGARLVFKEKIAPRLILAYVFAFLGIYLLVKQSLAFDKGFVLGDLSALVSGILVSVYIIAGKRVRHEVSNTSFSTLLYTITGILFLGLAIAHDTPLWSDNSTTWLAILGLVILPTFLGHSLFLYLVKYMNINLMTCGKLIEPVMSSAIAYWLFAEAINANTVWAFLATSVSLVILFGPDIKKIIFKAKH
ncbi:MAG: DMT family transporter [Bdellovibrionia bacterium]